MAEEYTTVRVTKTDADRLNAFKIHPKQADSEAFAKVLDLAENSPQRG